MFAIKACLYCVFTEWCNQCNCERVFLTEMSVLFLSAWVQVGTCWICFPVFLISKCKCISWFVSASVYTPFFIVLLFPGSNTNNRGSISEWDINSNLRQQFCSLRGKICSYTVRCKEPYNTQTNKKKFLCHGTSCQCFSLPLVQLVDENKSENTAAPEDLDVVSASFWSHLCSARGIIFLNWRCICA